MPEFIASIGTNCEVAFNIRNTFAIEQAYPFDWWFTPVQAVAAILRDRFDLSVEESNLSHTTTPESVLNHKYGFLHHHDFPRGEGERVLPQWRDEIPTVAAKYRFLGDRFIRRERGKGGFGPVHPERGWDASRLYVATTVGRKRLRGDRGRGSGSLSAYPHHACHFQWSIGTVGGGREGRGSGPPHRCGGPSERLRRPDAGPSLREILARMVGSFDGR